MGFSIGATLVAMFDPDRFLKGTVAIILGLAGIVVLWKGIFPSMYRFIGAGALFVAAFAMWSWGMQ
jgi:hypothetical protein